MNIDKLVQTYHSTYDKGNAQFDSSFWDILKRADLFLPSGVSVSDFSEEDRDMIWNMAYLISCAKCKVIKVGGLSTSLTDIVNEIKKEAEIEIKEILELNLQHLCYELYLRQRRRR